MKKSVVVVLVNYCGFDDTKACMESILSSYDVSPFLVIVDNNSKDKENLEKLSEGNNNLHIIYNTENVGFGRANNIGINWAKKHINFEYLFLLNNDTLIEPNTILHLIEPFSKDPQIGITTGKILYEGNKDIVWYGGGEINYQRGWPRITDYNIKPTVMGANLSKHVDFVSGCAMMFSKNSIDIIKGFDKDLFMYSEDLELSMRAKKEKLHCWYVSNAIIYHKVQGSFSKKGTAGFNKSNPNLPFLFYHMKKNQWIVMQKHMKIGDFIVFNCLYWCELFYRMLIFISWGRLDLIKTSFKIWFDILKYRFKLYIE